MVVAGYKVGEEAIWVTLVRIMIICLWPYLLVRRLPLSISKKNLIKLISTNASIVCVLNGILKTSCASILSNNPQYNFLHESENFKLRFVRKLILQSKLCEVIRKTKLIISQLEKF